MYRKLTDKTTLHLALLLHDLGKGYEEDHSEVGGGSPRRRPSGSRCRRSRPKTLEFLVHRHLFMSHLGLKYDTSQPHLVSRFAEEVARRSGSICCSW